MSKTEDSFILNNKLLFRLAKTVKFWAF